MSKPPPNSGERFTVWHGLLLAEGAAAAIGLLMPITPSKIGSERGLAELLFDEPSYLQEALIYFAMTNALFVMIAVAVWIWLRPRAERRRD